MVIENVVKEQYHGALVASSGNGMRCQFACDVEAASPADARLKVKSAWEAQSSLVNPRILEIRLWKDGVPVE